MHRNITNKGGIPSSLTKTFNKSIANIMVLAIASLALVVTAIFCLLPSFSISGLSTQTEKGAVRAATDPPVTATGTYLEYTAVTGGVAVTGLSASFKALYPAHDNITIVISATDPSSNPIVEIGTNAFNELSSYNPNYDFVALDASAATNLTSIGDAAFTNCASLTSIDLPNSLTTIGYGAFCYASLTSIDLSNTLVTEIAADAFTSCASLTSIDLPDSLTTLGDYVFSHSGLTSIDLSNTLVTEIAVGAFTSCASQIGRASCRERV